MACAKMNTVLLYNCPKQWQYGLLRCHSSTGMHLPITRTTAYEFESMLFWDEPTYDYYEEVKGHEQCTVQPIGSAMLQEKLKIR